MSDSSSLPPDEFETWQEIAEYLRISVREAQYRAKDEGLPIHRGAGKKGRVWALRSELDEWKASRLRSVADAAAGTGVSLVPPSSPIETGMRRDAGGPLIARKRLSRRTALAATAAGVGGIALAGFAAAIWRRPEMAMLGVDGPALIARDATGRELWRHVFPGGLFAANYTPAALAASYWIGDLDGDGHAEALFRYDSLNLSGENSSLYCFGRSGHVRWVFQPGHVVRDSAGVILPLYHIYTMLVCFGAGPRREARIAVSSIHPTDQPCQLAILDASGRLIAEYWHPGQLLLLAESRSGFGADPRIIAGGVNNGEHRATLVVLNPFTMKGASTPSHMKDQAFRLLDMPEANEEAVVIFPRSCLSSAEPYTRVSELEADSHAVRVKVTESHDLSARIIYYDFDPALGLTRVLPSSEYIAEHRQKERSGDLAHSAQADEASLQRSMEIRRKLL